MSYSSMVMESVKNYAELTFYKAISRMNKNDEIYRISKGF